MRAASATKNLFEPDAVTLLFQHSRGLPRLLQNLALGALLAAANPNKNKERMWLVLELIVGQSPCQRMTDFSGMLPVDDVIR